MKKLIWQEIIVKDNVEHAAYKVHLWRGLIVCTFYAFGHPDTEVRGSNSTGSKIYDNTRQAIQAGQRYLKKFRANAE